MKNNADYNGKKFFLIAILLCTCVFGIWFLVLYKPCTNWLTADALAALFNGLAFVAVFCALMVNIKSNEVMHKEMRKTADANKKSVIISRDMIKAQYLLFWIQRTEGQYSDYLLRLRNCEEQIEKYKNDDFDAGALGESARLRKFTDLYENNVKELERLTQHSTSTLDEDK